MQIVRQSLEIGIILIAFVYKAQIMAISHHHNRHKEHDNVLPQSDSPAPNNIANCTTCMLRDEARQARIDKIKEDLLQKLGFKEPPTPSVRDMAPYVPHIEGLLQRWGFDSGNVLSDEPDYTRMRYETDNYNAQTEKVFAFATRPPIFFGLPDDQPIAYFKFSNETTNNHVENVTLRFYVKRPTNVDAFEPVSKLVARLFKIDRRDGTKIEIMHKLFKKDLRLDGHWEEFRGINITKLVRHWFRKPELNYGLSVEVDFMGENLVVMPRSPQVDKYTMYLEVRVKDNDRNRHKRDTTRMDCHERDNETRCCRYSLQIDFESFGWDWVIAPKKYVAYYCAGECPFLHLQRYAHTHIVQQQANSRANVRPCCYPTSMGSITMVFFNHNKEVHVSRLPGMVVNRCGCA
uniref:TGF-beta family profile domain-containing protein n=1 Tax=Romanomermis culicivorax TaxID=13658 RepID=A0A915HT79_ROMCU